jgi:PTS system nitrogen regulatory IIA component
MDLTVRDAAHLLQVSDKDVYHWIRDGSLPAHRLHDQYRLNRVELLEWATANKLNVSPELFHDSEQPGGGCTLVEAIRKGGVLHGIAGMDKAGVLRAVVEQLRLPQSVDRDYFLQLLMAREALSSTGIGNGIALPHARNPVVLHLTQPSVTISFLKQPVDFGALDGSPVYVLFTLLSPTTHMHLHILSRLSYCLRDANVLNLLEKRADQEAILSRVSAVEAALLPRQASGPPGVTTT